MILLNKIDWKKIVCGVLFLVTASIASLWMILAVWFSNLPGNTLPKISALLLSIVVLATLKLSKNRKYASGIISGLLVVIFPWWILILPSNVRDWHPSATQLTTTEFSESSDTIAIRNIRNFEYRSSEDFDIRYYDKDIDLDEVKAVDFIVSYWGNTSIAHTLLSFGFEDGYQLAVSIEIRPEVGESYHPLAGMFKQYELIYVIGDERDLIRLRTNYRNEETYLYRSTASPEQARSLLIDILSRANQLASEPAFYGTIRQNCTTSLVQHINQVLVDDIPFSGRLLFNGYSDSLAYSRGNIRQDLPFEDLKAACYISEIARSLGTDPEFSRKIREHIQKNIREHNP